MPTPAQPPARYLPFSAGRYEVKPGLKRFGTDFGNAAADRQLFQLDQRFHHYRRTKGDARAERFDQYVLTEDYRAASAGAVAAFIAQRLAHEHPRWFALSHEGERHWLTCRLTDETLAFNADWSLDPRSCVAAIAPPYLHAFDALACQVQEDLAVTCAEGQRHWLAALHVCLPSHWSPAEKIGRSFADVHAPVPGMEEINRRQEHYVQQMLDASDGLVRFVFGLQFDDQLNSHPAHQARAVPFDPHQPCAFLRVERQTIWSIPHITPSTSLFSIRPYLLDVRELAGQPEHLRNLVAAIQSMSTEALAYKGLSTARDPLIAWLTRLADA